MFSVILICYDNAEVWASNPGGVEPHVGVDHYDVPWVEGGLQTTRAGPVTFWWWFEVPGFDSRQLGLPGGEVHIIHMEMCSWSRGSWHKD